MICVSLCYPAGEFCCAHGAMSSRQQERWACRRASGGECCSPPLGLAAHFFGANLAVVVSLVTSGRSGEDVRRQPVRFRRGEASAQNLDQALVVRAGSVRDRGAGDAAVDLHAGVTQTVLDEHAGGADSTSGRSAGGAQAAALVAREPRNRRWRAAPAQPNTAYDLNGA